MNNINPQKHVTFDRLGDKIKVILSDSRFRKTFEKEVSTNNTKELEKLLNDLKNKGVDFIGIIKKKMLSDSDWFD